MSDRRRSAPFTISEMRAMARHRVLSGAVGLFVVLGLASGDARAGKNAGGVELATTGRTLAGPAVVEIGYGAGEWKEVWAPGVEQVVCLTGVLNRGERVEVLADGQVVRWLTPRACEPDAGGRRACDSSAPVASRATSAGASIGR